MLLKRIAVMTSGGDCPGMNAGIRSVVRTGLTYNIEVYGIEHGYTGLIEGKIAKLTTADVANTIQRGGTFLKSARCMEFKTEEGQKKAVSSLARHEIDGLIVIGGDGSLTGANILHRDYNIKVIGLPGSIDNDIYGTDISIGADTALNNIINCIDMINDTASSHDRTFIIEVMGRNSGYLAVRSAIASGAEAVLIPEVPYNLENIIQMIRKRYEEGKTRSIIIVAEGVGSAYDFGKVLTLMGGFDTRIMVLGHIQRGGSPSVFDRLLATRMASKAVEALLEGKSGYMTGMEGNNVTLVDFNTVLSSKKPLDETLLKLAETLIS